MQQMEKWASDALNQVLETMFYATAEPRQKQQPGELLYQAAINFDGSRGGCLQVKLSKRLAQLLAGSFCGTGEDQFSEDQIHDVVKELTNMVAGSFVALAAPSLGPVILSVPEVARIGSESGTEQVNPTTAVALQFEVEEEDLTLLVSLKED